MSNSPPHEEEEQLRREREREPHDEHAPDELEQREVHVADHAGRRLGARVVVIPKLVFVVDIRLTVVQRIDARERHASEVALGGGGAQARARTCESRCARFSFHFPAATTHSKPPRAAAIMPPVMNC